MSSTSVIADPPRQYVGVPPLQLAPRRSAGPVLIGPTAALVALRQAAVAPLGGLADATIRPDGRLVAAYDPAGTAWWIAADAVWSDAVTSVHPERLRAVGLATGASREHAMVLGLSDRLGREALHHLEHGAELPQLDAPSDWTTGAVFDGRPITGVPTVVVVGESFVRWGAGSTWDAAMHRAVHGKSPAENAPEELADLRKRLDGDHLILAVDVGSELLAKAGISRLSVQLATPHDGMGR